MNKIFNFFLLFIAVVLSVIGCHKRASKSSKEYNDGQLHGEAPTYKANPMKPFGMVYIPSGTFTMGASDEDVNYSYTARNKQISISGFWMDATEITNNEYRQFVNWTRDSIALTALGYFATRRDSGSASANNIPLDWKQKSKIKYDNSTLEKLGNALMYDVPDRLYGKVEVDPRKIVYHYEEFDLKRAAKQRDRSLPRSAFMRKVDVAVYPDTMVWMRDFTYSYNEPMTKRYYSHPSFGNYPVVGVSWKQAVAFCNWRTHYLNSFLVKNKIAPESDYRLPTEAEWEYAARGGRTNAMFPWGSYYLRNMKGCLLANFKPGRGNYPEDGGLYTVKADAYWPNDFGLYNMSGNVAEWTSSYYYESAYNMEHDLNPDIQYMANDDDPPRMKRKVVRGGSWKDVGYYLQVGTRSFSYQDTAKSYIGFRTVIDLAPKTYSK